VARASRASVPAPLRRAAEGVPAVRLAVLSDLHAAARRPEVIRAVAASMEAAGAEWLVCAGDVGAGGADDALRCLRALDRACAGRALFVAGNHDIWCPPGEPGDSWDQWRRLLTFPGSLERGNRDLGGGLCAVGVGGWYDYSLGDDGPWTRDDVERKQWGNVLWRDAALARWGATDAEVCAGFGQLLQQRLDEAAAAGLRAVAVTHVLPFAQAVQRRPDDPTWTFCNAFMGSSAYGEAIAARGCALAVFGHTHTRKRGMAAGVPYVCAPLGYEQDWQDADAAAEVARALAVVDVSAAHGRVG
jgi:putative phosphoesterase